MSDKVWDYRVIRTRAKDTTALTEDQLSIQEVYYDDDEKMMAHTLDLGISGKSIPSLREQLQKMMWCLDNGTLDAMTQEIEEPDDMMEFHTKEYIYESPDNGKTLYRRELNKNNREEIEKTL